ncbi:Receptor kinase-like protein Xa21 [Forsythia ovata]|uniref:Receptor kinase-like protein Xa21 n=1 Tax=Forsythia ovata TaxID=205694 RepID=A0ABD1WAS5_9LAMI
MKDAADRNSHYESIKLKHSSNISCNFSNRIHAKRNPCLNISSSHENKFSGVIPNSLGDCLTLEKLHMEGNNFVGTIPSSLGHLKTTEIVDLSRNNLSGTIPASLENLHWTENLNLSFNMLEGEVPTQGVFTNINVFSVLGNEKLCGGIRP